MREQCPWKTDGKRCTELSCTRRGTYCEEHRPLAFSARGRKGAMTGTAEDRSARSRKGGLAGGLARVANHTPAELSDINRAGGMALVDSLTPTGLRDMMRNVRAGLADALADALWDCVKCDTLFTPTSSQSKYCSDDCRPERDNDPVHWHSQYLSELQLGCCGICKQLVPDWAETHVDHIHPVSFGGSDARDNLQFTHAFCNISWGDRIHMYGIPKPCRHDEGFPGSKL